MEYRLLGRTGVSVSPLCLGTMMFGPWGNNDRADAVASFTVRSMPGSTSSTPLTCTRAVCRRRSSARPCRDAANDVVLATKFFMPMGGRPNQSGGSRKLDHAGGREFAAAARSTDYIDLYQVHRPERDDIRGDPRCADRSRPPGQGPLHRIVLLIQPARSSRRNGCRRERHLARFVSEQPPYSILVRGIEEDVLPTVQRYGMGTLVYARCPVAG